MDIAKQLSLAWGFDLDDLKLEHEWNQRPIYGGIMRFSRAAKEARPLNTPFSKFYFFSLLRPTSHSPLSGSWACILHL